MGTVKYSGPVASFHCPTEATIRSLKVHFSPKQEGSGTPSPENIRPIEGWDGVTVHNDKDGVVIPEEYQKIEYLESTGTQYIDTGVEPTINTEWFVDFSNFNGLNNRYTGLGGSGAAGSYINVSVDINNYERSYASFGNIVDRQFTSTALGVGYWNDGRHTIQISKDGVWMDGIDTLVKFTGATFVPNGDTICIFARKSNSSIQRYIKVRIFSNEIRSNGTLVSRLVPCVRKTDSKPGMYDTVSGEFFTNQGTGEFICGPDIGETTNYTFGVLGKNKFNWDVPVSEASPVSSDAATARQFTLDTYVIGMSVNNYYRQNYANWVLNPSVENGVISFSSNAASGYGIAFPLKLAAGQTYFLSGTGDGTVGATYYDENGELISYQNGRLNKTITVPENAATTLIGFYASTSNTGFTFSNIQLELGSTATTYEPYSPNHTVYGGWVDLISGEVVEEGIDNYPYEFISLNGTENWALVKQNEQTTIFKYNYGIKAKDEGKSICSHFILGRGSYTQLNIPNSFVHGMSGNLFIQTDNALASTIEEFTNYLQEQYQNNTPVSVLFQANRANKTYNLPPYSTELKTFLGTNNVWSNADYVEVEYDLHETQNILARKQFIIANQPHTVKASGSLVNFDTDMAAALKECKVYFGPVQEGEGDPSPENVRPITGWTGVEVTSCGKNLFDINLLAANNITISNGVATATATNFSRAFGSSYVPLNLDMSARQWTLTMTAYTDGNANTENVIGLLARFVYSDGSKHSLYFYNTNTSSTTSTITTLANKTPLGIQISYGAGGSNIWHITDIQLEPVLEATTYEPYNGTTLPIDWTDEAGTVYGGYVDLVKGEVVKEVIKVTPNDIVSFHDITDRGNGVYEICLNLPIYARSDRRTEAKCSCFLYGSTSTGIADRFDLTYVLNQKARQIRVSHHFEEVPTIDAYREYLQSIGFEVVYYVDQERYAIDPQILKSLRGTNNVWSNANGNIELSYWKH